METTSKFDRLKNWAPDCSTQIWWKVIRHVLKVYFKPSRKNKDFVFLPVPTLPCWQKILHLKRYQYFYKISCKKTIHTCFSEIAVIWVNRKYLRIISNHFQYSSSGSLITSYTIWVNDLDGEFLLYTILKLNSSCLFQTQTTTKKTQLNLVQFKMKVLYC